MPTNSHKVTHGYVFFEKSILIVAQLVFGDIKLYLAGEIPQVGKSSLAHQAQLHQASGSAGFSLIRQGFGFSAGMLFITAANADETSKADVFNAEMRVWMSNRFTSTFIEQITQNRAISMRDIYYRLFINTVGSHVMVYNAVNYGNLYSADMSEFINFVANK